MLHAFAAYVAGNRRIIAFAGDFVNFVDEDNATLGFPDIVVGNLKQTGEKALDVFAYVSCLSEDGCVHDGEGNVEQLRDGACNESLAGTGRSDHYYVALFDFDAVVRLGLVKTFVMIIYSYREIFFRLILTDDILVEECFDLVRLGNFFQGFFRFGSLVAGSAVSGPCTRSCVIPGITDEAEH